MSDKLSAPLDEIDGVDAPVFVSAWGAEDVVVSSEPSLFAVDEWHRHRHHSHDPPQGAAPAIGDKALVVVCYGVTEQGRDVCITITGSFRRALVWFPDEARLDAYFGDAVDALVWFLGAEIDGTQFKLVSPHRAQGVHAGQRYAVEVRLGSNRAAQRLLDGTLSAATFPFLDASVHRVEVTEPMEGAELVTRVVRRLPEAGWIRCGASAREVDSDCDVTLVCPMRDIHPA